MEAFILETSEKLSRCTDPEVRDACLLEGIQQINHYKICGYGTAAAYATTLDLENESRMFREAEINEKQIDDRLSQLAEHEVNRLARAPIVLTL
jgi:ferritin-like metal-binding protein YciE